MSVILEAKILGTVEILRTITVGLKFHIRLCIKTVSTKKAVQLTEEMRNTDKNGKERSN
jgi:hypothetical protein